MSAPVAPRIFEAVTVYRCWRCRKSGQWRRTFTIAFVDGAPVRSYQPAELLQSIPCLLCGGDFEVVAEVDADADSSCRTRCRPASGPRHSCQCRTCFGERHGVEQP